MPISTVGDYLKKWEFTSKKPIKRAYERKDTATKQWLEEEYPKIQKGAKKEDADIWWCDETASQNLANNPKGYTLKGSHNKPVLEHSAKRVHHAKLVKTWEQEHSDKIKLFYLLAYSPDYNPDEYLNQDFKQSANKYEIPTNLKQLRSNTEKYMLSLQNNPQKVANFFKHPKVQYAALHAS